MLEERERKKDKIVRLMHRRIFPTVSKKLFGFRLLCFSLDRLKGALTYFLGCVAKEYVCGITWKFFATHRSFYNTALVINIEIEQ